MLRLDKENVGHLPGNALWELSFVRKAHVKTAFLLSAFTRLYAPVFGTLIGRWWGSDDYGHGFLVPFIALYFVWAKRRHLAELELQPSYFGGIPLIVLAGMMLLGGKLGGVILLEQISLLVMITGLVLLLSGWIYLKALALPIAYLILMIPILGEVTNEVHWQFQLLAANIGVWLLRFLGLPVFQQAQFIQLPWITMEVAEVCSGVRYLISVIAIGIPLAYFTQRTWLRRVGLVGFAVAIAILANGLRVALVGVWSSYSREILHGPLHIFQGLFVAWIGFVVLFAGAWFLGKGPRGSKEDIPETRADAGSLTRTLQRGTGSVGSLSDQWNRSWPAAIFLLLAIGGYYHFYRVTPVPLIKDLAGFPMVVGEWQGEGADPQGYPFRVRGADAEMLRVYRDTAGQVVSLYIGYFESQNQARELVNFRTKAFHRGAVPLEIATGGDRSYRINRVVLHRGGESYAALFWYELNGRTIPDRYRAKLMTIVDALFHRRTNGALILISSTLDDQQRHGDALTDQKDFVRNLTPILRSYFP